MSATRSDQAESERRLSEAALWKVRLDSPAADETDFREFEAWIVLPGARGAFDRIELLDAELAAHRDLIGRDMARADDEQQAEADRVARKAESRRRFVINGAGIGALAAAAVGGVYVTPRLGWVAYSTGKGERRSLILADGSMVQLNSASAIRAKITSRSRQIFMGEGEASFDVAHDKARPFLVAIGDQQVRVVGTEFNVLNAPGRMVVTVRRGIVEVATTKPGLFDVVRLTAGDQLMFKDAAVVRSADAADRAFAWQSGRLIYDGVTLTELVADLNRYYPGVIRVDRDVAGLKFSGILALEEKRQVIRTLEGFLPVQAVQIDGAVLLRKRNNVLAP